MSGPSAGFTFGPLTTIICASARRNSRHAFTASSMRNAPAELPPGATRTVLLRKTKSSRNDSRPFEKGRMTGPTNVAFGRSTPRSTARTHTLSRLRRDRIQGSPIASANRATSPPRKAWLTEWMSATVGTLRRAASRIVAISPSEIRNRNRVQSASFRRNFRANRRYRAYSQYHRSIEWITPRSWNHSGVGGRGIASNPCATARSRAGEPARKNRYRSGWRRTSSSAMAIERAAWPRPMEFAATYPASSAMAAHRTAGPIKTTRSPRKHGASLSAVSDESFYRAMTVPGDVDLRRVALCLLLGEYGAYPPSAGVFPP